MAKKRVSGEGTIVAVAGGFRGAITIGYNAAGRRKRKWFSGKTSAAVRDQMACYKVNLLDGTTCESGGQTVGALVMEWLENSARLTVKPSTYISYEVVVRRHIVPRIGRVKVDKVGASHVQAMQASLEREGVSPRLRQYAHTLLSRAFKQAVRWGRIPRNPCDQIDRPKAPRVEFKVLDAQQAQAMMRAACQGGSLSRLVRPGDRHGNALGRVVWSSLG